MGIEAGVEAHVSPQNARMLGTVRNMGTVLGNQSPAPPD